MLTFMDTEGSGTAVVSMYRLEIAVDRGKSATRKIQHLARGMFQELQAESMNLTNDN